MLRGDEVRHIMELKREGLSVQAISGLTGMDRKTVRPTLEGGDPHLAAEPIAKPAYRGTLPTCRNSSHPGRHGTVDTTVCEA